MLMKYCLMICTSVRWTVVRCLFFFFSSRRRHTRSDRDWSSDVCSSDLNPHERRYMRGRRWDVLAGGVGRVLDGRAALGCRAQAIADVHVPVPSERGDAAPDRKSVV